VARAQGYGLRTQEYLQSANGRICTVVQIEHILGVQNVEAILATPGVDAALVGPYDLSASLGLPGQVDEPPVRAAIQRVLGAGHAAGKPAGVFAGGLEAGEKALAQGFDFVAVGIDSLLLAQAAARIVSQLRPRSRHAAA
jgi:2-keto-3-deoxy-L-rhamnonate aldolase RhmA